MNLLGIRVMLVGSHFLELVLDEREVEQIITRWIGGAQTVFHGVDQRQDKVRWAFHSKDVVGIHSAPYIPAAITPAPGQFQPMSGQQIVRNW